jgi:hypothetical protein
VATYVNGRVQSDNDTATHLLISRARTVVVPLASDGGEVELSFDSSIDFRLPLTESLSAIELTDVPAPGTGQSICIMIVQGGGGFTLPATWTGVTRWRTTAPTISAVPGALTVVVIWSTGDEVAGDFARY